MSMKPSKKKIIANDPKYAKRFFTAIEEEVRVRKNVDVINEQLAGLEDILDKELSEAEELGVLDVVDEYTPKDKKGNYLYDLLPFDYAWTIYQTKKELLLDFLRKTLN